MNMQSQKPKRKEKPKNRPVVYRRVALFVVLMLFAAGSAFYLTMKHQSDAPVFLSVEATPDYEGICTVTEGRYQIQVIELSEDNPSVIDEQSPIESDDADFFYQVDIADLQTEDIKAATDTGDPLATRDGQAFVVTWADKPQSDASRRVFITWADVETSETHTLRGDFKSVYDLLWSDDSGWLAYTYWREDDTGVEVINRETKEIHALVTNAKSVDHKTYDAKTGLWSVWWTDTNNQARVGLFDTDGEKLFEMQIHSGLKNSRTWQTYSFPSPTGDETVFKLVQDEGAHEYLVLLDDDDDMHLMADNVQGLGDPDWSEDGAYVLWSHYRDNAFQYTVSIADADGERLWQTKLKELPQLIWSDCN